MITHNADGARVYPLAPHEIPKARGESANPAGFRSADPRVSLREPRGMCGFYLSILHIHTLNRK